MSATVSNNEKLKADLLSRYTPTGPERGGLILRDETLLELENASTEPTEGFLPNITPELLDALDSSIGTWHTHPGSTANLSAEDWQTFVQWPEHVHVIVGSDGPRWYAVEKGAVVNAA